VIIKILLIAAALGVAVLLLQEKVPGQREASRRVAGLLLVVVAIVAVLWPQLTTTAAIAVGVGRGTDLVLYLFVMVFAYSGLVTAQRIHRLQHDITVLTRELALSRPSRPERAAVPRPSAADPTAGDPAVREQL
jgi:hypothetical protein